MALAPVTTRLAPAPSKLSSSPAKAAAQKPESFSDVGPADVYVASFTAAENASQSPIRRPLVDISGVKIESELSYGSLNLNVEAAPYSIIAVREQQQAVDATGAVKPTDGIGKGTQIYATGSSGRLIVPLGVDGVKAEVQVLSDLLSPTAQVVVDAPPRK